MPMYKYRCAACGQRFEELLPLSRKNSAVCPVCGAAAEREWTEKCAFSVKSGGQSDERPGACADCPFCGK